MLRAEELLKIQNEKNYIHSAKDGNSLQSFLRRYPNGASDVVICKVLHLSQVELDNLYKSAIMKLQGGFNEVKTPTTE